MLVVNLYNAKYNSVCYQYIWWLEWNTKWLLRKTLSFQASHDKSFLWQTQFHESSRAWKLVRNIVANQVPTYESTFSKRLTSRHSDVLCALFALCPYDKQNNETKNVLWVKQIRIEGTLRCDLRMNLAGTLLTGRSNGWVTLLGYVFLVFSLCLSMVMKSFTCPFAQFYYIVLCYLNQIKKKPGKVNF